MRFTLWRMMEAVAVVAILLKAILEAISFPPVAPAVFGFVGAVAVHLIALRSERFQVGWVARGFGLGAVIGGGFYNSMDRGLYRDIWTVRKVVTGTIVPAMIITLVLLGTHHARQKTSQEKSNIGASSTLWSLPVRRS